MTDEDIIVFRDLTDEEINNLTDKDIGLIRLSYQFKGVPYRATVKSLLEDFDIKTDDLSDFILGFEVGFCNFANRTKDKILIYRKGNLKKDNIVINLDKSKDIPNLVLQIQVTDNFVHEEAYTMDGMLIYKT